MTLTIERSVSFTKAAHGRKHLHVKSPEPVTPRPIGRVPRITKFMALAIRFEGYLHDGIVKDYSDLARLGQVTRARMSQIMNLRLLAPDIQEELLLLPRIECGTAPIHLRLLQPIAQQCDWAKQRRMWKKLQSRVHEHSA